MKSLRDASISLTGARIQLMEPMDVRAALRCLGRARHELEVFICYAAIELEVRATVQRMKGGR